MRKLASIRKIDEIRPIVGADAIECAVLGGWTVVVKRNEYKAGDLAIYCEVDSFIPNSIAPFLTKGNSEPREYNHIKGERLRTVRLRGQLSQGLLLPLQTVVNEVAYDYPYAALELSNGNVACVKEGDDVTELLKIQKWEPPIPACLAGQIAGIFPSEWRKTDQPRIQNFINEEFENLKTVKYEVSIKLDGTSCSVGLTHDLTYTVCSRNYSLKTTQEGNTYVNVCRIYDLEQKLKNFGRPIQISGELIGENIQKNQENIKGHDFFVFDIYDPVCKKFLPATERLELCEYFGLKHVPVLVNNVSLSEINLNNYADILKFAEGKSLNSPSREGLVFKSLNGDISWKVISNSWLLKNE